MTRDDIYDHLAQVYLGKRKAEDPRHKKQFNAWLLINFLIMLIIFASAFYGLTAFLTKQQATLKDHVVYVLHNGPIRMPYDFKDTAQPTQSFVLKVPQIQASKYNHVEFALRGKEEGVPGIIKVVIEDSRNEKAAYYVQGVHKDWQRFHIPLSAFKEITDWDSLTKISFVLESWNVTDKKGLLLIDDVHLASIQARN